MKTFNVPQNVRRQAELGLKLRKEHGRGGLTTQQAGKLGIGSGVQRASDLKSGSVSYKTVKRMLAFFNRHKAYKKNHTTNPPSNSNISWLLWGGDAGFAWAKRIVAKEENVEKGSFLALSLFGDDFPEEEEGGFLDLIRKSRQVEPEPEPEPEPELDLEFNISLDDSIMPIIKKGLKVRKKTEFTLAKNVGQAIRRGHFEDLNLEEIEKCLDGLGTEEGAVEASLVGAHIMLEAIEKAEPKVPEKYLEGLTGKERAKRKKEIIARIRGKQSYKPMTGDDRKTKPSKYTKTAIASAIREEIKGKGKDEFLRASAKVSGVSKKILEQVYDRGLKAWATSGHRVGATAQQWAKARVYSFLSGGKTTKTADKDLYEKTKGRNR